MLRNHHQNMQTSLGHPLDLAERLGLHPDRGQTEFLNQYASPDPHDMDLDRRIGEHPLQAVALGCLWTLLSEPGAHISVVSSDSDAATIFLEFLDRICKTIDPAVTSVCRWSKPTVLMVGAEAKGELRLHPTSNPAHVVGMSQRRSVLVVIGAGSSDIKFEETVANLKPALFPTAKVIQLW